MKTVGVCLSVVIPTKKVGHEGVQYGKCTKVGIRVVLSVGEKGWNLFPAVSANPIYNINDRDCKPVWRCPMFEV
jgi:hypothetical protein